MCLNNAKPFVIQKDEIEGYQFMMMRRTIEGKEFFQSPFNGWQRSLVKPEDGFEHEPEHEIGKWSKCDFFSGGRGHPYYKPGYHFVRNLASLKRKMILFHSVCEQKMRYGLEPVIVKSYFAGTHTKGRDVGSLIVYVAKERCILRVVQTVDQMKPLMEVLNHRETHGFITGNWRQYVAAIKKQNDAIRMGI